MSARPRNETFLNASRKAYDDDDDDDDGALRAVHDSA